MIFRARNRDGSTVSAAPLSLRAVWPIVVLNRQAPLVQVFDNYGNPLALPSSRFAGLVQPSAISWIPCENLYVIADAATNTLKFYGIDGESYPFRVGPYPDLDHPVSIAISVLGPSLALIVANEGSDTITYFPYWAAGTGWSDVRIPKIAVTAATYNDIQNVVYVLSAPAGKIVGYNGSYRATTPGMFAGLKTPTALLETVGNIGGRNVDESGAILYVTDFGENAVKIFTQKGNRIGLDEPFQGLDAPDAIAFGGPGILVANYGNNTITAYDGRGKLVPMPGAFAGIHYPFAMLEGGTSRPCFDARHHLERFTTNGEWRPIVR